MPIYRPPQLKRIGRALRKAREAKGITQLSLAQRMGYKGEDAGAQISRIENGLLEPRLGTLLRFAKALGIANITELVAYAKAKKKG